MRLGVVGMIPSDLSMIQAEHLEAVRKLDLTGFGVVVLRAVTGREDDGLARVVPAGESGRADSAAGRGLHEVPGTADEVVLRVRLKLLDAFGDRDEPVMT